MPKSKNQLKRNPKLKSHVKPTKKASHPKPIVAPLVPVPQVSDDHAIVEVPGVAEAPHVAIVLPDTPHVQSRLSKIMKGIHDLLVGPTDDDQLLD